MNGLSKYVRPGDIKGNTAYDIIMRAWLAHKVDQLPDEQQRMLERWKQADRLLRNGELVKKITTEGIESNHQRFNVSMVVEWLVENYGISQRTAYEDIHNTKRFFLSLESRPEIEYERNIAILIGDELRELCIKKGDMKAAAAVFKEVNVIKGLHEQSIEAPDYSEFQPPEFTITTSATDLGFEYVDAEAATKRILGEKRLEFLQSEAVDAEEVDDE
ncbi:hypothetical protein [Mucilaginibacter sp. CSA2-8R]|uniref:hypothetical protein n=1 Tax=Mucilaginibacter sp. CSA2-8R TaxID=3141542 RepID=UPI00315DC86A